MPGLAGRKLKEYDWCNLAGSLRVAGGGVIRVSNEGQKTF